MRTKTSSFFKTLFDYILKKESNISIIKKGEPKRQISTIFPEATRYNGQHDPAFCSSHVTLVGGCHMGHLLGGNAATWWET